MTSPLLFYCSAASELLPPLAAVAWRRQLTDARRLVVVWCLIQVIANVVGFQLAFKHLNNHPVSYVALPFQGAAILWALSLWQLKPVSRLTLRLAIPVFVVAWIVLVATTENLYNFSAVAEPVYSMLALSAALYTLLTRSAATNESLLREDWFLMCTGLALHFGALAVLTPVAAAYLYRNQQLVMRAYEVRAAFNITAFVIIAVGFTCPRTAPSGLSS